MREDHFPFDRVLVMDRFPLTGMALCGLTDDVAGRYCSQYVTTLSAVKEVLQARAGEYLLLITELMSHHETMREGMALLNSLQPLLEDGLCRVMVCTDLTDPLLLRAVVKARPSVLALRREPVAVLRQAIRLASAAWPDMVLSPAATDGLALVRDVYLTPRELEWLVTQVDTPGLQASAQVMNVSYKTVASWRRSIALRLGKSGAGSFTWYQAQMWESCPESRFCRSKRGENS